MNLDPLCFLLMIEALLLTGGGLVYTACRLSRWKKLAERPGASDHTPLARMLEEGIAETEKRLDSVPEGTEAFPVLLAGKVGELHLDVMKKFLEAIQSKTAQPLDSISGWIREGFEESLTGRLQDLERHFEARPQKDGEGSSGEGSGTESPEVRCLSDEVPEQGSKGKGPTFVREGVDAKAAIAKMRNQFSTVTEYNNELREQLNRLREEKASSKEYAELLSRNIQQVEGVIEELEQSNRELNLCVSTLESANDHLTNQIQGLMKKWASDGDRFEREGGEEGDAPGVPEGGDPGTSDPVEEEDLETLKKSLEIVEEGYIHLYTELSPFRDPARAEPTETYDPETQQKILEMEERLAQKEGEIETIQKRIEAIESRRPGQGEEKEGGGASGTQEQDEEDRAA